MLKRAQSSNQSNTKRDTDDRITVEEFKFICVNCRAYSRRLFRQFEEQTPLAIRDEMEKTQIVRKIAEASATYNEGQDTIEFWNQLEVVANTPEALLAKQKKLGQFLIIFFSYDGNKHNQSLRKHLLTFNTPLPENSDIPIFTKNMRSPPIQSMGSFRILNGNYTYIHPTETESASTGNQAPANASATAALSAVPVIKESTVIPAPTTANTAAPSSEYLTRLGAQKLVDDEWDVHKSNVPYRLEGSKFQGLASIAAPSSTSASATSTFNEPTTIDPNIAKAKELVTQAIVLPTPASQPSASPVVIASVNTTNDTFIDTLQNKSFNFNPFLDQSCTQQMKILCDCATAATAPSAISVTKESTISTIHAPQPNAAASLPSVPPDSAIDITKAKHDSEKDSNKLEENRYSLAGPFPKTPNLGIAAPSSTSNIKATPSTPPIALVAPISTAGAASAITQKTAEPSRLGEHLRADLQNILTNWLNRKIVKYNAKDYEGVSTILSKTPNTNSYKKWHIIFGLYTALEDNQPQSPKSIAELQTQVKLALNPENKASGLHKDSSSPFGKAMKTFSFWKPERIPGPNALDTLRNLQNYLNLYQKSIKDIIQDAAQSSFSADPKKQ